jgi:hypothetical protein
MANAKLRDGIAPTDMEQAMVDKLDRALKNCRRFRELCTAR